MIFDAKIKGTAAPVIRNLEGLPDRVHKALATGLRRGLVYAAGVSQRNYLSGPRPARLDVRSTRLRNAVATEVQEQPGLIIGRMGNNVLYAAIHEFGFHGMVNVASHTRITGFFSAISGRRLQLRRPIKDRVGNFIGYKDSNADVLARLHARGQLGSQVRSAGVTSVRAHQRLLNYSGRPFIRPALEDSLGEITGEINKELKGVSENG